MSSPDQLDVLLKVVAPTRWLMLVALGAILAALVVWSLVGSLTQRIVRPALVNQTETILFVPLSDAARLAIGMPVTVRMDVDNSVRTGSVAAIGETPLQQAELLQWVRDDRWLTRFSPEPATVLVRVIHAEETAYADAWATASIDVAQIRPISFLIPTQ